MEEILEMDSSNLDNAGVKPSDLALEVKSSILKNSSGEKVVRFELPPLIEEFLIKNIKLMEQFSNVIPLLEELNNSRTPVRTKFKNSKEYLYAKAKAHVFKDL